MATTKPKHNITLKLHLGRRTLSEAEADTIRAFVAATPCQVHAVLPGSPLIEVRGLSEAGAANILTEFAKLGIACRVEQFTARSYRRRM